MSKNEAQVGVGTLHQFVRREVIGAISGRRCTCGGAFRADITPDDIGDSIPELGIEECVQCGALWQIEEAKIVRGPLTPNATGHFRPGAQRRDVK